MKTRIEHRRDERTGVDIPHRVMEFDDGGKGSEIIWGAATSRHIYLLNNRQRLAVPGDLNSAGVPA